jgi:acetylornithine/succinyldiaminopimelate/putrescine aminotransferase
MDEEGLIENARTLGQYLAGRLTELDARLSSTVGTRGLGLLQGLVLADDVDPGAIIAAVHASGLLLTLAGGHVVRISPSLNVTQEELDEGLAILERILSDAPRTS